METTTSNFKLDIDSNGTSKPQEQTEDCHSLVFYVNGVKVEDPSPDPEMTLLTYLRTRRIPKLYILMYMYTLYKPNFED
ncbi:xanthine dehydrogenase [Elysia marginata]|uniref:Xanthine dehydrogenase n=1 Tax=Elysia marginata TaxID=1093978 RepID=A0AAV4F6A7_9GAST|nr:xanthine dehydrogenase [Elysia marginata]